MASPRSAASPGSFDRSRSNGGRALAVATPSTANRVSSTGDEVIWKRLREAGFDEETVKRRDKAALLAYVTRLETEIYDYQCNMGLILLEKKDLESKYDETKVSSLAAEKMFMHDKAAILSALEESRKREENLKKALEIEKDCLANIEKTLHEMRAESAEIKVAYESKFCEAKSMMETAQKMFDEATSRLHEVESSQAEASRRQNTALRTLHDIEAREDALRRRSTSFQSECEAKEREHSFQRQSLNDSYKILHQEQNRLNERQNLLSQREEYLHGRLNELSVREKELAGVRLKLEEDSSMLKDEKANLDLHVSALAAREEVVIQREALLDQKDRDLLVLQEKICNKEFDEIQRLKAEYQSSLERKSCEFEARMEKERKILEEEIEAKTSVYNGREAELKQKEQQIMEMEKAVQAEQYAVSEKQQDTMEKLHLLEVKENFVFHTEKLLESKLQELKTEKEEISKLNEELQKEKVLLQNEKTEILFAEEKLALTANERNEIVVLEKKLKEEIDSFRAQMLDLEVKADQLKLEKEKFENEWELIDEKREELKKEADLIIKEREAVSTYLRNELDNLNFEKEVLRNQLKQNAESLTRERDEFMKKMEHEHSDWLIKCHKEKEDFMNDVVIQRKELENSISRRREEIENYLKEKEESFRQEMCKELQSISSQKEEITEQLKHAESELKRLDNERLEIALDREQRQREWSEIRSFIEELTVQREKLQRQRELLHADRDEIDKQIQDLMKLESLNIELESRRLYDTNADNPVVNNGSLFCRKSHRAAVKNGDDVDSRKNFLSDESKAKLSSKNATADTLSPTPMSWLRKCAEVIYKRLPERTISATLQENCETVLDAQTLEFRRNKEKNSHSLEDSSVSFNEERCETNSRNHNLLPLRRKRLNHSGSTDCNDSNPDQTNMKRLRVNSIANMETVLHWCSPNKITSTIHGSSTIVSISIDGDNFVITTFTDMSVLPGDHPAEGVLLEAIGSSALIRLADDRCELKEHEDFDEKMDEHPSLGAKIKKFLIS